MIVTGSPVQAVVDTLKTALDADPTLDGLVEGVFGHLSETARVNYPYLVLGRRHRQNDGGAMGIIGGRVTVQLDGWSDHKGPSEMHTILSRVAAVLERRALTVVGYLAIANSLTCETEEVFFEPDEDKPATGLYHGVQLWAMDVHEAA